MRRIALWMARALLVAACAMVAWDGARMVLFLVEHAQVRPFHVEWFGVGVASGCENGACFTRLAPATVMTVLLWSAAAVVGVAACWRRELVVWYLGLAIVPALLNTAAHAAWLAPSPHFGAPEGVAYGRQMALVTLVVIAPALLMLLLDRDEPAPKPAAA